MTHAAAILTQRNARPSPRRHDDGHHEQPEKDSPMAHTPHELADEFPEDHALLHELKLTNAHYAVLAARYHDVNRAIHRSAAEVEPLGDEQLEGLKRQRLALLDEIAAMLAAARAQSAGAV
jgi:uncharacterized protein